MGTTVVGVFDSLGVAEQARAALISRGVTAHMHLEVREDDAGPVQGNFTVGNNATRGEGPDDHMYQDNYANPVQRGQCLLILDDVEASQFEHASAILRQYGARVVPGRPM